MVAQTYDIAFINLLINLNCKFLYTPYLPTAGINYLINK